MSLPHQIHYKLKQSSAAAPPSSQQGWSTIQWEGAHHLSTLEVKRHITQQLGLQSSHDSFEFMISNASTGEEYRDDNYIIHRNTNLWVRKIIGSKERAALLKTKPTTGLLHTDKAADGSNSNSNSNTAADDDQQLLNIVQQSSRPSRPVGGYASSSPSPSPYAPQTYQRQSHGAHASTATGGNQGSPYGPITASSKPPPGYICHRCQQAGHFIRFCPTNGDPAYDGPKKPKAAIAVQQYENNAQKFFLRDVEDPKALAQIQQDNDQQTTASPIQPQQQQPYPLAEQAPPSSSTGYASSSVASPLPSQSHQQKERVRLDLSCPICSRLLDAPTYIPCCYRSFCRNCIEPAIRTDARCPLCHSGPIPLADLRPNTVLQHKIERYGREQNQYTNNSNHQHPTDQHANSQYPPMSASPSPAAPVPPFSKATDRDPRNPPSRSYHASRMNQSIPTYDGSQDDPRGRSPPRYRDGGESRDRERDRDRDRDYHHRDYERRGPPANSAGPQSIAVYDESYSQYQARDTQSRWDRRQASQQDAYINRGRGR